MRPECIQSVEAAIGRSLKAGEAADIEARIIKAKKDLAAQDRAEWSRMPETERLTAAGQRVGEQLMGDLAKKKQRLALDILASQRIQSDIDANPTLSPLNVLNRILAPFQDGQSRVQSIDTQARSIADLAKSEMLDLIDATKGAWLGFVTDMKMNQNIVRELHGQQTGDAVAAKAAEQFKRTAENLRERFNRAGGQVGKLEDWAMPHSHSALRVAKAGRDQWVADTLPLMNREKFVNEDGTLMTDQQMAEFLGEAYVTISTSGANKVEAGQFNGGGKRSNRGSEERSLHYRDGDAWLEYQSKYGEQELGQTLMGHIDAISRDIALVERLGSNPNHMLRMYLDKAEQAEKLAGGDLNAINRLRSRTETLYAEVTKANLPVSMTLADWFKAYRGINIASRLGSTTITAITDQATIAVTARQHGLAWHRIFGKEMKLLNPANAADRQIAHEVGLGINELMAGLSRYADDGLGTAANMAGKAAKYGTTAASAIMRVSALNAMTSARKQAFSMMLMNKYGTMSRNKSWDDLLPDDRKMLEGTGITKQDWQIWQKAQPMDRDGDLILSAKDIMRIPDDQLTEFGNPQTVREQAATRYHAHVLDEQGMAILEAGSREQAKLFGGVQKGTYTGEIWRSMLQFKSFTAALMMRHGVRMMSQEGVRGKAAYGAYFFVLATLLGGLAVQLRELFQGGDPNDMTESDFWQKAVLAGGGLGIYGDILKAGTTSDGKGVAEVAGGPILGDAVGIAKIANRGVRSAMGDDKANAGNEVVKFAKSHIPAANLWYTRAATDRLIFNQLHDLANPNYTKRKEARDRRMYDRTAWWSPDDLMPDDSPDWEKAVGE